MAATFTDYFAAIGIGSGCEYAATAACAGYRSANPTQAAQAAYREMGVPARPMPFIDFQGDKDTTVPPINADQRVQRWLFTNDLADDGAADPSVATEPASTSSGGSGSRPYTVSTYSDKTKNDLGGFSRPRHRQCLVGRERVAALFRLGRTRRDRRHVRVLQRNPDPSPSARRPRRPPVNQPTPTPRPFPTPPAPSPPPRPEPNQPPGAAPVPTDGHVRVPAVSKLRLPTAGSSSRCQARDRRRCGSSDRSPAIVRRSPQVAATALATRPGARIARTVANAGRISIAMPKRIHGHRLPRGRYRAMVTPADRAGRTGNSRTLAVVMR